MFGHRFHRCAKYLTGTLGSHNSIWTGMLWWISCGIVVATEMVCHHDNAVFSHRVFLQLTSYHSSSYLDISRNAKVWKLSFLSWERTDQSVQWKLVVVYSSMKRLCQQKHTYTHSLTHTSWFNYLITGIPEVRSKYHSVHVCMHTSWEHF